jgi:thermostable 8-oxoguanine DNA glycosylase
MKEEKNNSCSKSLGNNIKTAWNIPSPDLQDKFKKFNYQQDLTKDLDSKSGDFDEHLLNKIALWKVNRYFKLSNDLLKRLNDLKHVRPENYEECKDVLEELLDKGLKGIDLPMASTILRFRNPTTFQIIDKRAYRAVMCEPLAINSSTSVNRKVQIYFSYLEELRRFSEEKNIAFQDLDRVLYQFDKEENREVDINGNRKKKGL